MLTHTDATRPFKTTTAIPRFVPLKVQGHDASLEVERYGNKVCIKTKSDAGVTQRLWIDKGDYLNFVAHLAANARVFKTGEHIT
jgi:hypothetical protein